MPAFPLAMLAAFVLVPVIAGFVLGEDRLIHLLGHTFLVNRSSERDLRITVAIWAVLFAFAYVLALWAA